MILNLQLQGKLWLNNGRVGFSGCQFLTNLCHIKVLCAFKPVSSVCALLQRQRRASL